MRTKARRIAGQAMRSPAEAGAKDVRVLDDDGTTASSRGAAADGTPVRGPVR
jgi:hypothetical protein